MPAPNKRRGQDIIKLKSFKTENSNTVVRTILCRVQLSNKPCPQISAFDASLIGVNMVFSLLQRRFVVSFNAT